MGRRSVALLLALGGLTACSGSPTPVAQPSADQSEAQPSADQSVTQPSAGTAPALAADVTQYRRDQALDQVAIKLTNLGADDLALRQLRLESTGFDPGPTTERSTTLRPAITVDVPVRYGAPRCHEQPTGGRAVLQVGEGDQVREVSVVLPAGGVLALVHERECRALALADAVDLRFADDWPEVVVDGRPALQPTLLLTRREGQDRVVVQDVAGHVLFTVRARPDRPAPLLVLDPAQRSASLPLEVVASRCDGHALAESKRTPVFLFYVSLGDGEARRIEVTAPPAVHPLLSDVATRTCVG